MNFRDDLNRIKKEKENTKKQHDQHETKVLEKQKQAIRKFDHMVRKLLDELGMATWGKGILIKHYKVGRLPGKPMVWVVRKVPTYADCTTYRADSDDIHPLESWKLSEYRMSLCFDDEGNASHFSVLGEKIDLSEDKLKTALVKYFKRGPGTAEYSGYDGYPIKLL